MRKMTAMIMTTDHQAPPIAAPNADALVERLRGLLHQADRIHGGYLSIWKEDIRDLLTRLATAEAASQQVVEECARVAEGKVIITTTARSRSAAEAMREAIAAAIRAMPLAVGKGEGDV